MRAERVEHIQRDVRVQERRGHVAHRPRRPTERVRPRGPIDRGQPTEFLPGGHPTDFTVLGILNDTSLTWTIASGQPQPLGLARRHGHDDFETKCGVDPEPPDPPDPPIHRIHRTRPTRPTRRRGPYPDPVGVFVQCVTNRGSTYDAVFGYQNDNEDIVRIEVGNRNQFLPAPQARGQTTDFLPGNHQEAFTVTGIQAENALAWEVTHAGDTRVATVASNFPEKCSASPAPAQPIGIFACIVDRGSTYDVVFGYESDNPADVTIPIGLANVVLPRPINRGQPTVFSPGKHEDALRFAGYQTIGWCPGSSRTAAPDSNRVLRVGDQVLRDGPGLPLEIAPLCVRREGQPYTAGFSYANLTRSDMVIPVGRANGVSPAPRTVVSPWSSGRGSCCSRSPSVTFRSRRT